jgi:gamma-glutamylcyclotransferase (GGCT)/AIG2-like uncharacterized protein YtfP
MNNTSQEKTNLFIYGSLRDPYIFRSVSGFGFTLKPSHKDPRVLYGELALLTGYRRVSPDNVYFYAVEDPSSRIEGIVIYDVPASAMAEIDKYEGKLYERQSVSVNTAGGMVEATAYLVSSKKMVKKFGDRFHVNLIHELWLRKRIADFLSKHKRPGEKTIDADTERRAFRELLGTTERDLVISHLGTEAVSDYFLAQELDKPTSSIKHLLNDSQAKNYFENYIKLTIKQVILNQLEEKIQSRYRYELEHMMSSARYFYHCMSLLIALKMINSNISSVESILKSSTRSMPVNGDYDLIDYIKYAVRAADSLFDPRVARSGIEWIQNNQQPGLTPIGAELEFSNLGYRALYKDAYDYDFCGFKYFKDFKLDVLTWKLGGYIDDHTDSLWEPRRTGFLELAPGRLNVEGELSKPATSDPWMLNQIIHEIMQFYPIQPHSLHLTFQIRKRQLGKHKILPLGFVKCLLALGGGTKKTTDGTLWISRMSQGEIREDRGDEQFVFTRISKRKAQMPLGEVDMRRRRNRPTPTLQYKFIRLDPRANYEPLIMALKGLQIAYNPGEYLNSLQLKRSNRLKRHYEMLKEWADYTTAIDRKTRKRFLDTVREGLMNEAHYKPAHKPHYIEWAIGAIDVQLRLFNKQIEGRSIYFH